MGQQDQNTSMFIFKLINRPMDTVSLRNRCNTRFRQTLQSRAEPNSELSTWKVWCLKQLRRSDWNLDSLLIYLDRCDSGRPLWNGCTGNTDKLTVVFLALFQVPCHFSEGCWSLCNTSLTYLKSIFIFFLKIFFRGRIGIFCCRCYTTKSFCKDYTGFNN